ncbi:hypothetical protein MGN70_001078 [Eutypa lata]|nr:hypothetical protein MGN70_001078 [Eutypa lata]
MACLNILPTELIHIVGGYLASLGDCAAFAATNRRLYGILNPMLYRLMARTCGKRAIFYGASAGILQTVKKSLDAGVDPASVWTSENRGALLSELMLKVTDDCPANWWDDASLSSKTYPDSDLTNLETWITESLLCPYDWTALHIAAYKGHDDIVSAILDSRETSALFINEDSRGICSCEIPKVLSALRDLYLDEVTDPCWKPLHYAICSGHISIAKLLLSRGASIHTISNRNITVLHAACQYGLLTLANFIVDNGYHTCLNELDQAGQTPIVYAFLYRQWDCFDWLLEQGADIHYPLWKNLARLMLNDACLDMDLEAAYRVLDYGLELDEESLELQQNPLHIILQGPWDPNIVRKEDGKAELAQARGTFGAVLLPKLLNKRSLIDHVDPISGSTPLALAARYRVLPAIYALLAAGADVNACGVEGMTPLYEACKIYRLYPDKKIVALLLEHGAHVDKPNRYGMTPLYTACSSPKETYQETTDTVILLVNHGADPLARCQDDDSADMTPLAKALMKGMPSICSILVSKLDRRRLDAAEFAELFHKLIATSSGQPAFEFLLNLDTENTIARNPRFLYLLTAHPSHSRNAIHMLLDRGASCTYVAEYKDTAIVYAITNDLGVDIVQRLLNGGANPNFVRLDGVCPLICAHRGKSPRYAYGRLLLQHGADIHKPLDASNQGMPNELLTPLIWAIMDHDIGNRDAVRIMLEYQPFRGRPGAPSSQTVLAAVKAGNVLALNAMIESGIDIRHIRDNADDLLLALLEEIPEKVDNYSRETKPEKIFKNVNDWVDTMDLLIKHGARWAAKDNAGTSAVELVKELVSPEDKSAHETTVAFRLSRRLLLSGDSSFFHIMAAESE